jgi:taurine dioxygenase
MNLNISVNKNGVGVTINNVNLVNDISSLLILQIQELLNRYKVVVFKDQHLTDEQLSDFAFRFGPPFVPDNKFPVLGSQDQ